MKVGYYAPLPPARTGVADYAAALLAGLRRFGEVEVNAPLADIGLYHLGNNQLHAKIYERAIREPGIVVLHDAVLQHFYLGRLDERAYVAEFIYNYGEWNADLARDLWHSRARSAADPRYFAYPMLKRATQQALAVVVHNPQAAAMVRAHGPDAQIHEIPHLFEMPALPAPDEIARVRTGLGVLPGTHLFAVFGHLRESKRLPVILRAFGRVRREVAGALLVAGAFASTDLERVLAPVLRADGIVRRGYVPDAEFWRLASAVDSCINLRYPAAGETSGIAVRLRIGKPVILTTNTVERIPPGACLRVDAGLAEEDMLVESMLWLARHREAARAIGQNAARHILLHHALDRVAAQYWQVLAACYHKNAG